MARSFVAVLLLPIGVACGGRVDSNMVDTPGVDGGGEAQSETNAGGGGEAQETNGGGGAGGQAVEKGDAEIDDHFLPIDQAQAARVPLKHRAAPQICSPGRPPGNATRPSDAGDDCGQDADCQRGINGRCMVAGFHADAGWRAVCSYDQCASNEDCPPSMVCGCRDGSASFAAPFGESRCVPADCRVDADCGKAQYCSPSYSCGGRVDCHTLADECVDDSDCSTEGSFRGYCAYDGVRRWACLNFCRD